jgi:hypothetical protein
MTLEAFFQEIDRAWPDQRAGKNQLRLLGSTALMLQTDYARGTKDGDVLDTVTLTVETKDRLLALAGVGSRLHARHQIYIDIINNGLPFLPQRPLWHPLAELNASLRMFEIEVLDVVDVVVSKMKRFNANDQSDVQAMIDRDLVPPARLVSRFRAAVDLFSGDARAEDLPRYVRSLHRVERDMLGVPETEIELPDWI